MSCNIQVYGHTFKAFTNCDTLFSFNEGGILLLEVDRMLRAGGYFVWAAQPVYKHEEKLQETWKGTVSGEEED